MSRILNWGSTWAKCSCYTAPSLKIAYQLKYWSFNGRRQNTQREKQQNLHSKIKIRDFSLYKKKKMSDSDLYFLSPRFFPQYITARIACWGMDGCDWRIKIVNQTVGILVEIWKRYYKNCFILPRSWCVRLNLPRVRWDQEKYLLF